MIPVNKNKKKQELNWESSHNLQRFLQKNLFKSISIIPMPIKVKHIPIIRLFLNFFSINKLTSSLFFTPGLFAVTFKNFIFELIF